MTRNRMVTKREDQALEGKVPLCPSQSSTAQILPARTANTAPRNRMSPHGALARSRLTTRSLVSSLLPSIPLSMSKLISIFRGHLYRHHLVFQCPRCKTLFPSQDKLDGHFTAIQGCDLSTAEAAEGITVNIEKRLKSRKKTYRHQTEVDRWKEMYQIIFPREDIPSPC
jgi:hypothetical protein